MTLIALLASNAFAANPDVKAVITPPSSQTVYASERWNVTVSNIGNRDAAGTTVSIQLPTTNTSPSVYVMGTVGAKSASCTASGTKLNIVSSYSPFCASDDIKSSSSTRHFPKRLCVRTLTLWNGLWKSSMTPENSYQCP